MTDQKRSQRSNTTYDKSSSSGSRKYFDPELQAFTKKKLFTYQSNLDKNDREQEKLTFTQVLQRMQIALQHFYSIDKIGFYSICKEFFSKGWQVWRLNILQRFNTYQQLQEALQHKSFSYIENEIIREWKKNYLLYGIAIYWYDCIQKTNIRTIKEFKQHYELFRDFISEISYLIFQRWFKTLEKKKKLPILTKIYAETTHFIIADSTEWKKIYLKHLKPLICKELKYYPINWNYDLEELKIKEFIAVDYRKQTSTSKIQNKDNNNLKETIEVLRKFSSEIKLKKKIQLLRDVRVTMEKEIMQNQNVMIQKGKQKKYQMLQKDDFLIANIYCIVRGELKQIQESIKYLQIILGDNFQLLSSLQLSIYVIDIIAAIDCLVENKQQQQIIELHSVKNKVLKMQSTPVLQSYNATSLGQLDELGEINLKEYRSFNDGQKKRIETSMKCMIGLDECKEEE